MMELVIRDGLQNGSWVTNHQETKPFSKKRRVSSKKTFLRSKARTRIKKQKKDDIGENTCDVERSEPVPPER